MWTLPGPGLSQSSSTWPFSSRRCPSLGIQVPILTWFSPAVLHLLLQTLLLPLNCARYLFRDVFFGFFSVRVVRELSSWLSPPQMPTQSTEPQLWTLKRRSPLNGRRVYPSSYLTFPLGWTTRIFDQISPRQANISSASTLKYVLNTISSRTVSCRIKWRFYAPHGSDRLHCMNG